MASGDTYMRTPLQMEMKNNVSEIIFPGFCRDDFNNKKRLRVDKLASIGQAGRSLSMRVLKLAKLDRLFGQKDRSVFILGVDYLFSRELFTSTNGRKSFPYKMTMWVSSSGNTSCTVEQSMTRVQDNEAKQLAHMSTTFVCIDRKTRRPIPLPDEVRECMSTDGLNPGEQRKFEVLEIPNIYFVYDVEVQPSDIDANLHTNHSSYVRFSSDCARMASVSGFFKGDPDSLPVLELRTFYVGESKDGDCLRVYTWQDSKSPDVLYFVICKNNQPIFHCQWRIDLMPVSSL